MVELTFLGTGTSSGVPMIGCECSICTSNDPRDRRSRTSAVVRVDGHTILIDTATELRLQSIAVGLKQVDAVLYTHSHADHVGGVDDLRRFNQLNQAHLPVYADAPTAAVLRERYGYAFEDRFPFYGGKPDLILHEFDRPFRLFGVDIVPIPVKHGRWVIHGYRIGPLAYITDAKEIPPSSVDLIRGVDVLVVNALREQSHPTHLSLAEALCVVEDIAPRQAYLVHVGHELSHAAASANLPANVEVAYDGLTIQTR